MTEGTKISGTSVAMIEKHYGHLRADVAATALEAVMNLKRTRKLFY